MPWCSAALWLVAWGGECEGDEEDHNHECCEGMFKGAERDG